MIEQALGSAAAVEEVNWRLAAGESVTVEGIYEYDAQERAGVTQALHGSVADPSGDWEP